MLKSILIKGLSLLLVVAVSVGSSYLFWKQANNLGSAVPRVVANFSTSLQASISSSDTSMTLVTGTDAAGTSLTGYTCFTLDEGTSSEEHICGTASGTSITSLLRGISPVDGNLEVTALKKSHRRGASVKITDHPIIADLARKANGQESYPAKLYYDQDFTFTYGSHQFADWDNTKDYADSLANTGAADATTALQGLVELSTQAELVAGTGTGGTGATLVIPGLYYTSSSSAQKVPVTNISGYIDSSFINLSSTGGLQATGNNLFSILLPTGSGLVTNSGGLKLTASPSFGGDGSDGALSVTSGTTTLSFSGRQNLVKNYTSINISGTGALAFTASNSYGSVATLRSQGDCTITSSATRAIDLRRMGGEGGSPGAGGQRGGASFGIIASRQFAGGTGGATGVPTPGGVAFANYGGYFDYSSSSFNIQQSRRFLVVPGPGGGGGDIAGGDGGGSIILECAGALNITGTIDVSGTDGVSGTFGGGGGGAGGMIVILYKTLTADSGTYTISGGAGGNGSGGGDPGAGGGAGMLSTPGGASSGDDGGAGASGSVVRMKNNTFY